MAGESIWPTRPLKDCAVWYSGGTPNKSTPRYWGGSIPWISAKSLNDFFVTDSEDRVTEEGAANGTRLVPKDSILFIVRGMSLKSEFRMGITTRPVTFNQDLKALVAVNDVVPAYLAYAIRAKTNEILQMVGEAGHGTGVLPTDRIQSLEVAVPSVEEQRAIARILGALDDKIELNRKTNATLEAMARALFKSWFVDFDPVRAKADGRAPSGIDAETANLFPSEFVDSELGPIPKGWSVQPLDAIADFRNGLALQKFRPNDGEPRLPVVKIAQLRTGQPDSGEWARADITSDCIIDNGDVVFSWSGSLTVVVWCGGRAALNQHLFRVSSRVYPKWFFLNWLLEHLPEFQRIASDKATTMGHIQRHHLTGANCVVPGRSVLEAAEHSFAPLLARRIALDLEGRQLARLRDELLPRLLSRELSIAAAERSAERGE